jgi:ketosteroid isomerase-like protein
MGMKHPHATLLEKLYSDLTRGDWAAFAAGCPDAMTFQVPGKSPLAGKYTKSNFAQGYGAKLKELSGGTFQTEVHDILASDRHVTVLATNRVTRNGKTTELRAVHVWRFEQGQPAAWYEYPRDLYQFDATWG